MSDETGPVSDREASGSAPEPEPLALTGEPAVDAVLRALVAAGAAAPDEQIPAYEAAHRTLRETLARIDEG